MTTFTDSEMMEILQTFRPPDAALPPPPLRTLEHSKNGRAQLRQRCEATWNACYPDRRKWAEIGEEAQAEWLRVFEVFDSLSTANVQAEAPQVASSR